MSGATGSPRRSARVELFGCAVDALTMDETVAAIDSIVRAGIPVQHVALNASGIVSNEDDARLRGIVESAGMVSADGQSMVWASRVLGRRVPERVAGPDLFARLIGLAAERGYPVYLLGARPEVVSAARAQLERTHPGLVVAGHRHGYFDDEESPALVAEISASGAKMLFVAMPTPRKEYWLSENLGALGVPFCMGVGGTFDIVAGVIRRAPLWMQRAGLEWAYRFAKEPRRMWRRYVVGNARFVLLTLRELSRGRGVRGA